MCARCYLYIDLCCLQQYTLQSTVHSWTIIMHLKVRMQIYNYRNTRLAPMWQQSGTLLFCSCHGIAGFLVDELQI